MRIYRMPRIRSRSRSREWNQWIPKLRSFIIIWQNRWVGSWKHSMMDSLHLIKLRRKRFHQQYKTRPSRRRLLKRKKRSKRRERKFLKLRKHQQPIQKKLLLNQRRRSLKITLMSRLKKLSLKLLQNLLQHLLQLPSKPKPKLKPQLPHLQNHQKKQLRQPWSQQPQPQRKKPPQSKLQLSLPKSIPSTNKKSKRWKVNSTCFYLRKNKKPKRKPRIKKIKKRKKRKLLKRKKKRKKGKRRKRKWRRRKKRSWRIFKSKLIASRRVISQRIRKQTCFLRDNKLQIPSQSRNLRSHRRSQLKQVRNQLNSQPKWLKLVLRHRLCQMNFNRERAFQLKISKHRPPS